MLPGPDVLKRSKDGAAARIISRIMLIMLIALPSRRVVSLVRPSEKPRCRHTDPAATPITNPISPMSAFRSPAARRRTIRRGQPRNTSAPIETQAPIRKRITGDEPERGLNSPFITEMMNAPSTRPRISGLRYCTVAVLCSPRLPAISRRKQAMQNPMLPGLPRSTRTNAAAATSAPVRISFLKYNDFHALSSIFCYNTGYEKDLF